ncbi:secreted protein [Candidatus Magnetobacterium bavaricum]|uniref:Secreted protein n=1 Tax=Candidatus Magnetobacterium bavaricum TaxID=29290 RepID=A0A0F3H340_9BACT|nr:secreted protein [Candidatus Magnetobacterium bavaricum]
MSKFKLKTLSVSLSLLCFLFVASCSYNVNIEPSDDLAETVKVFYDLKKQGRFFDTWLFERMSTYEDEKTRESAKERYFTNQGGKMQIKGYEIIEIGKEGSAIEGLTPVRMKISSTWPNLMGFTFPKGDNAFELEDLWQKINGKWYHVIRGMDRTW